MNKIILVICLMFVVSCTKEKKCELAQNAIDKLSPAIATGLECKNEAEIKADLTNVAVNAGLCEVQVTSEKGKIPAVVCELLAAQVVKFAASKIPEKWECSAENASEKLTEVLVKACDSI